MQMFRHWSLVNKFVTVFLLCITLPTLFFGLLIYDQTTQTFKMQAVHTAQGLLDKNVDNLTAIFQDVQNMTDYMIYDNDFRTFFRTPQQKQDQDAYRNAVNSMEGYFVFQLMSKGYIDSILIQSTNGNTLRYGDPVYSNEELLDKSAQEKAGAVFWSNPYQVMSDWNGKKTVISISRVINDINDISHPIGMVRIRMDEAKLYQIFQSGMPPQLGEIFALSSTGNVILHQNRALLGKPYPDSTFIKEVTNDQKPTFDYQTPQNHFLVVKKKLENTQLLLVAMVNEGEVVKGLFQVLASIRNMIILLSLLGVIAFIGFFYSIILRIVELTKQTRLVEKGDFSANVKVTSKDEIGTLGMRFNQMVETIQRSINVEYRLKIKQKESELKALQSQIDPHFLYNTLDMIRWTARLENAMETSRLIELLSQIFRMNLNNGKTWVKVKEELVYIQNYLELQKSRLGDRLAYRLFVDEQVKDTFVIKQILQPLVENSIQHGFRNLPRQGIIQIRVFQQNDRLCIDVIDNGWGIQPKGTEERENQHSGYALKNLTERLALAFGNQQGISFLETDVGVWIRLDLPLVKDATADESLQS
jgi:two-component system, sensor histidine kinase YesM